MRENNQANRVSRGRVSRDHCKPIPAHRKLTRVIQIEPLYPIKPPRLHKLYQVDARDFFTKIEFMSLPSAFDRNCPDVLVLAIDKLNTPIESTLRLP